MLLLTLCFFIRLIVGNHTKLHALVETFSGRSTDTTFDYLSHERSRFLNAIFPPEAMLPSKCHAQISILDFGEQPQAITNLHRSV